MKKLLVFCIFLHILQAKESLYSDFSQEQVKKPANINRVYVGKNQFKNIDDYHQERAEKRAQRREFIGLVFRAKKIAFKDFYIRMFDIVYLEKFNKNINYLIIKKNIKSIPKVNYMVVLPNVKAPTQVVSSEINKKMKLIKTITGDISPKSIINANNGQFWAQNMMYNHTNTVYNRDFELIRTIWDNINLADFGYTNLNGNYKGAPVEASFSPDGRFAYVTNYKMYGKGFDNPGSDICSPQNNHDNSFVYKIDTRSFKTQKAIKVGSVPKYIATSPSGNYIIVTNWCSYDVSVIDAKSDLEIKRVKLGKYPRGIAMNSKYAFIAVMGSTSIAKINLSDFSVTWINGVGISPRHLSIDPFGKYLYATLNGEGKVSKIDLQNSKVLNKITTGDAPRSMDISEDGEFLYIVNYGSNTMSKVRTSDMKVVDTVKTNSKPIGIAYDSINKQVWVACYSGSIQIFQD